METRANSFIVGVFVLITLVVGAVFTIWLATTGNKGPKKQYYVVFSGSVQGLDKGSFVLFNGLRVGEVSDIGINPGNTGQVRAFITVDQLTPVKRDSKTRLVYSGFTGVAAIEVVGGGQNSASLVPGDDGVPPTLYAEQSFVQNIMESGSETLNKINEVVGKVDKLIDDNGENISAAMSDLRQTVKNLQSMSANAEANGLVDNLNETAKSVRSAAQTLDERISIISRDISSFTGRGLKELNGLISDGRRTLNTVDKTVNDLDKNPQGVIFGRPGIPTYKGR